ncbi:phosphatidate cytidylyltransferase [Chloroflexota bacterium]
MLKKRLITGLCGTPLLIAAVWFGDPWLTLLIAIWGLLAGYEFYRIVAGNKVIPLTYLGLVWILLLIISPHFGYVFLKPLLFTAVAVISLIWLPLRSRKEEAFPAWVWTIAGIVYTGWLLSYFVELNLLGGRNWVFFAFFTIFAYDTAAFFVGRKLGRHYLAPDISPGKTWEGAIGGTIGAVIISLLFTLPTPLGVPLGYGQAILLGVLISVFGQLGDLAESLFKRSTGVKDSGKLIPGHGGALDRMDSVVFAGVVVYYYVLWAVS